MARFLIALLAAASTVTALKTPKSSRALKVRGGSTVQKVGTALIGLEGVVGMIAPEAACKNYGHTPTSDDIQFKRYTSTWLAGLALLLCADADAFGWHCATNIFLLAAAVLTVSMPCFEQLGLSKGLIAAWIPLTLVLGYLTSAGKISPWVAVAVAVGDGLAKFLLPESYFKFYGLDGRGPFSKFFKVPGAMSPFGKMFVRLQGSCLIAAGVYVLMLGRPGSQGQLEAFGYAYAVIAAAAIMAGLFDASKIPMSKIPHLVWGAIAAYIASAALSEVDHGVYTEPLSE